MKEAAVHVTAREHWDRWLKEDSRHQAKLVRRHSSSDRRRRDTEEQSSYSGHRGGCPPAGYLHVTCFPESRFSAPIAWSIIIVPNKVRLRFRDDDCLLIEHGSLVLFPSQYTHTSQSGASLHTRSTGERTTCAVASVHLKDKQSATLLCSSSF